MTNGSANGSLMSGSGCLDASARDAATPVAVAPTLDARSQVSPSVRAMTKSLLSFCDDGQRITHRRELVVVREFRPYSREHLRPGPRGHLPAVSCQIVDDMVALTRIEQIGQVDVEPVLLPFVTGAAARWPMLAPASGWYSVASLLPGALSAVMSSKSRSWASAAGTPAILGAPRRRLAVVESAAAQRCRPVFAQIDGHRAALRGRCRADGRHRLRLELDHLGLVDLVDDGARGPRQPVGRESSPEARITACRMPAAAASMKKSSKNLVRTAITVVIS